MASKESKTNKPVIMVHGDKGGVGKSIVCNMLVEYLLKNEVPTHLIETDTSNPDVYYVMKDRVAHTLQNLNEKEGWTELVNKVAECNDTIVINMAARLREATQKYGANFCDDLNELNRPLVLLWVINRQADSISLLRAALENLPTLKTVVVVKNLYWSGGNIAKFTLWDNSKTKIAIEENGGLTINFPDQDDTTVDLISNKRMSFIEATNNANDIGLRFGNKRDLERWVNEVFSTFDTVKEHLR